MSGYPLKNPTDASKFRQQYLSTLALQAKNDDINLQANKIYKKTGETPSQLSDTRTTAEKRADLERLKIEIRKELSPIADGIQSEQIISALSDDPEALIFLAQNITEIIKILQPKYKLGILATPFLIFFQKYMEKQTETEGVDYGLQQKTGENIIMGIRQIEQLVSPQVFTDLISQIRLDAQFLSRDLYRDITENIDDLKKVLPTKEFLTAISQIQDAITKANIQSSLSNTLEQLPNSQQISGLLRQLKVATSKQDVRRINEIGNQINQLINTDQQTKDQMNLLYQAVQEANPAARVVNPFERAAEGTAPPKAVPKVAQNYLSALQQPASATAKVPPATPLSQISLPEPLDASTLGLGPKRLNQLTQIHKSTDDLLSSSKSPDDLFNEYFEPIKKIIPSITLAKLGIKTLKSTTGEKKRKAVVILNYLIEPLIGVTPTTLTYLPQSQEAVAKAGAKPSYAGIPPQMLFQMTGQAPEVARGKQAGGAQAPIGKGIKGKGLSRKPKAIKINTEGGIKPQDEYVSLGRYFINKHKLNKNIVSVRTKTGHSAKLPVRRVSDNMSAVVKTILGGGMPSFDALEKLTDEEKNYLHKLSKQSNIIDKLSIPTPNKSQLDKDINEFEIMKGQIMNGNDNMEYIKKFKLLLMKLINQDVLPRNQGKEILCDIATLGY